MSYKTIDGTRSVCYSKESCLRWLLP